MYHFSFILIYSSVGDLLDCFDILIIVQWMLIYKYLLEFLFAILWRYRMKLLAHIIIPWLLSLGLLNLYSVVASFYIRISNAKIFLYLHILPTLVIFLFISFIIAILVCVKWFLIVLLICIYLVISDLEHFLYMLIGNLYVLFREISTHFLFLIALLVSFIVYL